VDLSWKKVHLVPLRRTTEAAPARKAPDLREHYAVRGPLAFVHVSLIDNSSEFLSSLRLKVTEDGQNFVVKVSGAIAIANTIAYISESIDPISIFLGVKTFDL
jgi:hypothetical protein